MTNSQNKEEDGLARLFLMTFFHINGIRQKEREEKYIMSNIWNYFGMGGKHYWCNKANTMRFYNAVMQGRKFLIFDLETTGLKKNADVIVDFSAVVMEKVGQFYQKTDEIEQYIKPPFTMTDEVIAIHGITNEFLEDKPEERDVWPVVKEFFEKHKDAVISGYNVGFDIKFMTAYAGRMKESFEPEEVVDIFGIVKENIFADEHDGCRKLSHILGILYPGKTYQFHNASDDILATWDVGVGVLKKFLESKPVLEESKHKAQISSYQYWKAGRTQRIYVTLRFSENFYEVYYDIYSSCWVCEDDKNNEFNIFEWVDMNDVENKLTKIAESKGKDKFRLLRDKDNWRSWKNIA